MTSETQYKKEKRTCCRCWFNQHHREGMCVDCKRYFEAPTLFSYAKKGRKVRILKNYKPIK